MVEENVGTSICQQCKKIFFGRKNQKYCSYECRCEANKAKTYIKICPHCGVEFETHNKKATYCSSICASRKRGDEIRGEYFCEYCGKPRHSDHPNRNRFCSRGCAQAAQKAKTRVRKEQEAEVKETEKIKKCKWCEKEFKASTRQQKYCSNACLRKYNDNEKRKRSMECYEEAVFYCAECGREVITKYGYRNRVYCSAECSRRAGHKQYAEVRKKQMLDSFVEYAGLKYVFERANGVCQICGLPVPRTAEPGNIWAATRDHNVPLSKGGKHCKANVQLAHRICNSIKCDRDTRWIDWNEKLEEEAERWSEAITDLCKQVEIEAVHVAAPLAPV